MTWGDEAHRDWRWLRWGLGWVFVLAVLAYAASDLTPVYEGERDEGREVSCLRCRDLSRPQSETPHHKGGALHTGVAAPVVRGSDDTPNLRGPGR